MSLAGFWLIASAVSSAIVVVDLVGRGGQKMWIMDVVWPVTALWAGPFGAWAYFRYGRGSARDQPFPVVAGKATTHCGAGCTLGDLLGAAAVALVPFAIAGEEIFAEWIYAFVAAYAIGIVFQYFTIRPMRRLSRRDGVIAAIKADSASLVAWQLGMYGWMAIARFAILGHPFDKASALYWTMMQIAMFAGFATSYPVNVLLLRHGLKEAM